MTLHLQMFYDTGHLQGSETESKAFRICKHSAKFTHFILYRDSALTQLPLGSRLLLRLGQDVKPRAAEKLLKLRMQKSKVLIFSCASDTETCKADYSDKRIYPRGWRQTGDECFVHYH